MPCGCSGPSTSTCSCEEPEYNGALGNTIIKPRISVPGNLGNTVVCRRSIPASIEDTFCVLSRGLLKSGPPSVITIVPTPVPFYPTSFGPPLVSYDNFGTGENINPITIPVAGIYNMKITVLFTTEVPAGVTVGLVAIQDFSIVGSDIVDEGADSAVINTTKNFSPGEITFLINLVSIDPLQTIPIAGSFASIHLLAPAVGTTVCYTAIY